MVGAQAEGPEAVEILEPLEVIGVTPLHGVGLELDRIPANVQTATGKGLQEQQSLDLTQFMNRNLGSVFVNNAQNNPLQANVQFRGFTASPLLGVPQGLSVYQDGVRVNEPFGDTVNWALIPDTAIASINLIPGSNPLFGLNTLGGALSVQTKNGFTHPGTRAEASTGSWSRHVLRAESGGAREDLSYFITANYFDEDGWRDHSKSDATNAFANLGWRGEGRNLELSVTYANTDLIGNGPAPEQLLSQDREAIFTRPDRTQNDPYWLVNLRGSQALTADIVADGNAYYRNSDIDTLNGDDSDFEQCTATPGLVCEVDEDGNEDPVLDQDGNPIPFGPGVDGATVNRTKTDQDSYGATLQFTFLQDLAGRENQFIVGGAIDRSDIRFRSSTELGSLDDSRLAVGAGVFDQGSFTRVNADNDNYSVYVTDTLSVTPDLALTLSGRYNRTHIDLRDQLGTELTGDHEFDRFNPAAGLTYRITPALNWYGGYSESTRAPTPVELTCANPDDPCRLPNAFLSDPPLDQVVAKTWETGLRGLWQNINWHLGLFRTVNHDDILFISAGALTGQGFFDNVGKTRRQGIEANLDGQAFGRLDWSLNYTYLDATFRDDFVVASPNNPAAVGGEIPVRSGDRLPTLPRHLFKAIGRYAITSKLSVGGDLLYQSSQYLRGDEANLSQTVSGYTLVNAWAEYRLTRHWVLFGKVDNVFDNNYETFGLFGDATEVLGNDFDNPRFLSPGAPRGAWVGIRLTL
jgi:outer membrane receptor protein involved in Fe transport